MHPAFDAIVDYAGLFPPASCSMDDAVARYAEYRAGSDRAMLGRFVLSAGRLLEFGESVGSQGLLPGSGPPWPLSVVFGANHPEELGRVAGFGSVFGNRGLVVEAIEAKVASAGETSVVAARLDPRWERFLEVPHQTHYGDLMGAIRDAGVGAKIRTGGSTPASFPTPTQLTRFLMAVTRYGVPFKATAGLHHPWCGSYPLTYAPDSERHQMYGFMNVMIATAVLRAGGDGEMAQAVLEETDPSVFERSGDVIIWRDERIAFADLEALRRDGFRGFGSCSFREPVDELAAAVAA
jgi:hypothetical protein